MNEIGLFLAAFCASALLVNQRRASNATREKADKDRLRTEGALRSVSQGLSLLNSGLAGARSNVEARRKETTQLSGDLTRLSNLVGGNIAIDVGFREDPGWLILTCRVDGQDRVVLNKLRRDMSMREYKHLVENLSRDFGHVAYIDAPHGVECFLKDVQKKSKSWSSR